MVVQVEKNMKKMLFVIGMMLFAIGCHHKHDCSNVGNVLNWRQNNFTTVVPAEKYRFANIYAKDRDCPLPTMARVPNSVPILDELLLKGTKVTVIVVAKGDPDGWETLLAECEGIFLQVFGARNNFTIVDRIKVTNILNEHALGQTGLMAEDSLSRIGKMTGATHLYHISASVAHNGPFKTVYFSGRLIDIQTGNVLSVDKMEN
jgi:hypothetical protein